MRLRAHSVTAAKANGQVTNRRIDQQPNSIPSRDLLKFCGPIDTEQCVAHAIARIEAGVAYAMRLHTLRLLQKAITHYVFAFCFQN